MSDNFISDTDIPYRYISRFDDEYPKKLQMIPSPPPGIYVKGNLPSPDIPSVAIVGSRICSQYGRLAAEQFGRVLGQNNIQVISGLARGIDGISQDACAGAGGKSFGVLGCGINVVYPKQNKHIYTNILDKGGGLISEVNPSSPPLGRHFASRNRIISALSDIVLVIEAKQKSGTAITVARALEQGKDIYAVPGRITDICSQGCNTLIEGGAGIACSPDTILSALGQFIPLTSQDNNLISPPPDLEPLEAAVYAQLDFYPVSIETLSHQTHFQPSELSVILFHLQLKKLISEVSRGQYIKLK